jgi:hypothetical protein
MLSTVRLARKSHLGHGGLSRYRARKLLELGHEYSLPHLHLRDTLQSSPSARLSKGDLELRCSGARTLQAPTPSQAFQLQI